MEDLDLINSFTRFRYKLKDLVCTITDDGILYKYNDCTYNNLNDLCNYMKIYAGNINEFKILCMDYISTSALLCFITSSHETIFDNETISVFTNDVSFKINFKVVHESNKIINEISNMDDETRRALYIECRFTINFCVNNSDRKLINDYFSIVSTPLDNNCIDTIVVNQSKTKVYIGKEYELKCKRYLQEKYPEYQVYLWKEFNDIIPAEQRSVDIGIDIVCIDQFGKLTGVQCKNFSKGNLNLSNLSTFFSSTQLSYTINNISRKFSKLIIATQPTIKMSQQLKQFITNLDKPVEFLKLAS